MSSSMGVSLALNYRAQFDQIIQRSSYDTSLHRIRSKAEDGSSRSTWRSWGLCHVGQRLDLLVGVPSPEHCAQFLVECFDAGLQQQMCTSLALLPLLAIAEPFAHCLLHCRLHETCGNRFAIPIPFSIIQDEMAVVCDVEVWQRFARKQATYGIGQKPRAMEAQVSIDFKGLLTCSLEWPKTSIFGQIPCSHRLLAKKRVKFQLIVYKLLIY
jgi:hypothetical protein